MSVGGGSPSNDARARSTENAAEAAVRTIGWPAVRRMRAERRSRRSAAARRVAAITSTSAGSRPRFSIAAATDSMAVVVFPVPGAPSTSNAAAPVADAIRSTTPRWPSSSTTAPPPARGAVSSSSPP